MYTQMGQAPRCGARCGTAHQGREIAYEINRLKVEKNAVILGHNYMEPALFASIPDIVGDSLELSRRAAQVEQDVIVFCGVEFMAETARFSTPARRCWCRRNGRAVRWPPASRRRMCASSRRNFPACRS
ncbi:MAG: quinolinate synthase NadA [Caldilineaceae bacterium]